MSKPRIIASGPMGARELDDEPVMARVKPGTAGVYIISNRLTSSCYIGASKDIWSRWTAHTSSLRRNKSDCRALQNAWNKYGASAFEFAILEVVVSRRNQKRAILETEQRYLDLFRPAYNILPTAGSFSGNVLSDEARKRIAEKNREATKRRWADPAYRAKVIAAHNRRYAEDPGLRQRLSDAHKGKKQSPELIEKRTIAQRIALARPEEKARRSAAAKRNMQNKELKDKFLAGAAKANANRVVSPEQRRKISETLQKWHSDPTNRDKYLASRKKIAT